VADLFKRGEFDKICSMKGHIQFVASERYSAPIFKDVKFSSVGVDMGVMATTL
jgi:hypothetical protein